MYSYRGFTLVEMMATIAVGSILLAIATPSFIQMTVKSRLVTYNNDLITAVNFARSEAIRRGTTVSICSSVTGTQCSNTVSKWSSGWIIFVNTDADNPAMVDAGETILRKHEALTTNYTIGTNAVFAKDIDFDADGAANGAGVFAICHDGNVEGAHAVVMTRLRPRSAQDPDGDRIPNKDDGNDISGCTNP